MKHLGFPVGSTIQSAGLVLTFTSKRHAAAFAREADANGYTVLPFMGREVRIHGAAFELKSEPLSATLRRGRGGK